MLPPAPVSPAAIYVHRIRRYWHSLLGISELASPRLIFRSHRRGNPKWAQPASGHLQALQIRNCPSGSGYRVPRSSLPQPSASTYVRIRLSLPFPGSSCRASCPFPLVTYPNRYNSDYPSLSWVTLVTAPTPVTASTLVTVGQLSSARSVISLARDVPVSPLFSPRSLAFFDQSGIWRISEFFDKHGASIFQEA